MGGDVVMLLVFVVIVVAPLFLGVDTRDGRDWQPRSDHRRWRP